MPKLSIIYNPVITDMRTIFRGLLTTILCLVGMSNSMVSAEEINSEDTENIEASNHYSWLLSPQQRNARSIYRLSPYMPYHTYLMRAMMESDSNATAIDTLLTGLAEELEFEESSDIELINIPDSVVEEIFVQRYHYPLPSGMYDIVIFDTYEFIDSLPLVPEYHGIEAGEAFDWIDDVNFGNQLLSLTRQSYMVNNPFSVKYNIDWLPEPPKHYKALVDPVTTRIVLTETTVAPTPEEKPNLDLRKRHWLRDFQGSVQFSQAYVSPNWYQGGNNNLNMIASGVYNVKLNEKYHPNLLFDTTISYKLGMNNAPNDTVHDYNISEDLFQINSKLGIKAIRKWYYSVAATFKTQLFNNYPVNSRSLSAAFLSPGELNVGLGMSYSTSDKNRGIEFGASISPLSYNLKTCFNSKVNETSYGIKEGRKTVSQYGSSAECNLKWQIAYNISYSTRLFAFTDYNYIMGDWEHTINFNINRFLSTQLYVHLRYDSSVDKLPDTNWNKFQLKEILSFGFNYKFSTI